MTVDPVRMVMQEYHAKAREALGFKPDSPIPTRKYIAVLHEQLYLMAQDILRMRSEEEKKK